MMTAIGNLNVAIGSVVYYGSHFYKNPHIPMWVPLKNALWESKNDLVAAEIRALIRMCGVQPDFEVLAEVGRVLVEELDANM